MENLRTFWSLETPIDDITGFESLNGLFKYMKMEGIKAYVRNSEIGYEKVAKMFAKNETIKVLEFESNLRSKTSSCIEIKKIEIKN